MIAAVILSGGSSSRMGSPKALLAYHGRPFLEHLLEVTVHPRIGVRRVVLGAHAEPIAKSIALTADEIVINEDWEKGQLSSIQAAIRSLSTTPGSLAKTGWPAQGGLHATARTEPPAVADLQAGIASPNVTGAADSKPGPFQSIDGLLLCLIDHPLISRALANYLIEQFYESGAPIVLPIYQGRRGHPVIFGASLFDELLHAPPDKGARAVVWAHAKEVLEVPTDEQGCILNLNDPETLHRATGSTD
jgi:molybdenum cofactor cytidylyltransferase